MDQIKTKHPEHRYKKGLDRNQGFLLPPSLEELVEADSPVRVIDAFVDSLDLAKLGFTHTHRRPGRCRKARLGTCRYVKALPLRLPEPHPQHPQTAKRMQAQPGGHLATGTGYSQSTGPSPISGQKTEKASVWLSGSLW